MHWACSEIQLIQHYWEKEGVAKVGVAESETPFLKSWIRHWAPQQCALATFRNFGGALTIGIKFWGARTPSAQVLPLPLHVKWKLDWRH